MAKFKNENGKLTIDGKPVIVGYESYSGWYWFATEISEERKVSEGGGSLMAGGKVMDDTIYFGFVQGFEEEWGYFSKAECESLPGKVWKIKPQDLPHAGRRT